MPRHYTFTILSVFILSVLALLYSKQSPNLPTVQAKNGAIDISRSIKENGSQTLNGEWLFFYNEFLSNEQVQARHLQGQAIEVPRNWQLGQFDAQADPSHGYGTYHLQVTIGKKAEPLAIRLPIIGTAYRLYVDNELLLSVGKAGRTKAQTTARYQPQVLPIKTKNEVVNITIHVANYDNEWGGIANPIKIGRVQSLFNEQKINSMQSMFLGGFLLAVALYNLILFSLRKSDALPLIFALLCLTLGLREFFVQNYIILNYLPDLTVSQLIKIECLAFFLAVPLIMHFNSLSFPAYFNKRVLSATYGAALLLSLMLLALGLEKASLIIMQMLLPLYIAYMLFITAKACHAQQKGAAVVLAGSLAFAFCAINDLLFSYQMISTGYFNGWGLAIYVLSQSYMAGIKFNQGFLQSHRLSKQLKKHNIKLQNLTLQLEDKVTERTNALAQANINLQKLAHTDTLTQVPNRLGMHWVIEQEQARFSRSGVPYAIAMIDLDYFKSINDQFGHDAGDEVLVKCALVVQDTIRQQDKLARWGGEEFIMLLPETDLQGATIVAERIRLAIAQSVVEINDVKISITATIGVVEALPGESFDAALKRSDIALFKGKEEGRNKVVVSSTTQASLTNPIQATIESQSQQSQDTHTLITTKT